MKGNTKLKITADGLRVIALRLALVIAKHALNWLYFIILILGLKANRKKA